MNKDKIEYYYFSAQAAKAHGYTTAILKNGEKIYYTCITDDEKADHYKWEDKVLMKTIKNTEEVKIINQIKGNNYLYDTSGSIIMDIDDVIAQSSNTLTYPKDAQLAKNLLEDLKPLPPIDLSELETRPEFRPILDVIKKIRNANEAESTNLPNLDLDEKNNAKLKK